jgi:hypothetical protein
VLALLPPLDTHSASDGVIEPLSVEPLSPSEASATKSKATKIVPMAAAVF